MDKKVANERRKLLSSVGKLLEGPMIFLGFIWLMLLIVELLWGLNTFLEYLTVAIWIVFIIDFLIKLIVAPDKWQFMKRNGLTAVSLVVPALRLFRILRVFRVLRGVRLLKVVSSLNRSMRSLGASMQRRGFGYVVMLALVVTFGGAAGMFAIERGNIGFENYGMALWWTAMRIITAGSDFWPSTPEGRALAFILSLFGYAVFGYVTATLATFFIGRDAEEAGAPVAGSHEVQELKKLIVTLTQKVEAMDRPKI